VSGTFVRENHPALLRIPHVNRLVYDYAAITLYGTTFQTFSSSLARSHGVHTPHLRGISPRIRFDLFRFRSPLLTESLLFSFPPGTKMFYFPGFPFPHLTDMGILRIIGPQVDVLFENLGVGAYVRLTQAYRSLSRSSSVPKPRYPPNSGGVMASTQGKVQIAHARIMRGKRYASRIRQVK
jgi:hypothetical protein